MKNKLPHWFKQNVPSLRVLEKIQLLSKLKINTVCQKAKCPNINNCFDNSKLTFMILGDYCTRNCGFCGVSRVKKVNPGVDKREPYRIRRIISLLGIKYAVITSVTRDDLADGGAGEFAKTVFLIKGLNRKINIEVLIPDLRGNEDSLKTIVESGPSVLGHNIETVKRLYQKLKPGSDYKLSLNLLGRVKGINEGLFTKSSIILGLGEKEKEVIETMRDLKSQSCDILTLGQYLSPGIRHFPVKEFISLDKFEKYREAGINLGFKMVLSGPLVRSSYNAEDLYLKIMPGG